MIRHVEKNNETNITNSFSLESEVIYATQNSGT